MPRLILVKHSLPEIVPALPANEWRLSEGGRPRCRVLAERLAAYSPFVTRGNGLEPFTFWKSLGLTSFVVLDSQDAKRRTQKFCV